MHFNSVLSLALSLSFFDSGGKVTLQDTCPLRGSLIFSLQPSNAELPAGFSFSSPGQECFDILGSDGRSGLLISLPFPSPTLFLSSSDSCGRVSLLVTCPLGDSLKPGTLSIGTKISSFSGLDGSV